MHYRHIALFLLLVCVAFQVVHAQQVVLPKHANCTNYSDSFDVRVLDAKLRVVSGALVQVTFDRGATFGSKYFTTSPRYTDSSGLVHFDLLNQGTNTRTIDCNIQINASLAGKCNITTVFALEHSTIIDLSLPLYPVRFYIRDRLGGPLANATISVSNLTETTDANGMAAFFLGKGSQAYLASYLDGSQAGQVNISDDATIEVVLRSYNVTFEVVDDFGSPLSATLFIFNRTFQLENGTFEYAKTFGEEIPYRTEYKGISQEGVLVPSVNTDARITYDIHAPLFGSMRPEVSGSRYQLVIPVSDPGSAPSGVNFNSIRVTYRVEPAEPTTPWSTAVTFTSGRDTVTAQFPALPPGSIVSFRAEMSDNSGNRATIEGKFSTLAAPANNTQNQTNPPPNGGQEQGIPLLYIFVGVIVALLIIYVVFRIKSQGGGNSG